MIIGEIGVRTWKRVALVKSEHKKPAFGATPRGKKEEGNTQPPKNLIVHSNFHGGWIVDMFLSSPNKVASNLG